METLGNLARGLASIVSRKPTEEAAPDAPADDSPAVPDIEDLKPFKSLIPLTMKEMKAQGVVPYSVEEREELLEELSETPGIPNFAEQVVKAGSNLKRRQSVVFQANIGLYCNQACNHCHVDSSPLRKEMMSREVTDKCLEILSKSPSIQVVDLTGGAPELNREFRHWVTGCRALGLEVIDRCNLTVLLEPHQQDLIGFLAENKVHIIASLPCYLEANVDGQRGNQVFDRSIEALKRLNQAGYGTANGLVLDLVYNPTGVHLPPAQPALEVAYKIELKEKYGIVFDQLHCITNMPINRFHDHLKAEDKLEQYMHILLEAFNPDTLDGLMCRDYVSVKWDGAIFDCDFNQQVELYPTADKRLTVFDIESTDDLLNVPIATNHHCYGCAAGAGSA